jgi:DNA repair protein RecO (recombination protein O)
MSGYTTPALLLRRIHYGDHDLIINLFTLDRGKVTVIAKAAKKSVKRFGGILELFSVLETVINPGRGKGLPVLQEAALVQPFANIRSDVVKTAYASYWAELVNTWMEEYERQDLIFELLAYVFEALDKGEARTRALSIVFQIRFMALSGLAPNLSRCSRCGLAVEKVRVPEINFSLKNGGIVCGDCGAFASHRVPLSLGTVKQLAWIQQRGLEQVSRLRFSEISLSESLALCEAFVPYHLGKEPKSLKFLRQIRKG